MPTDGHWHEKMKLILGTPEGECYFHNNFVFDLFPLVSEKDRKEFAEFGFTPERLLKMNAVLTYTSEKSFAVLIQQQK